MKKFNIPNEKLYEFIEKNIYQPEDINPNMIIYNAIIDHRLAENYDGSWNWDDDDGYEYRNLNWENRKGAKKYGTSYNKS